jgi:hypothetical protein
LLQDLLLSKYFTGYPNFSKPSEISDALPAMKILLWLGRMVAFTALETSAAVTLSIDFR